MVRIESNFRPESAASASGSALRGGAAVATWALRRKRRIVVASGEPAERLRNVLAAGRPSEDGNRLSYAGRDVALRPVVARLLKRLWQADGAPVAVADLCQAIYGRPASLRAVRQSAFRASRAMERLDCPLLVCCHAGFVFMRYRARTFERLSGAKI